MTSHDDRISMPVRRALISVSDKTDIVNFAASLNDLNIEILSTGGTAKVLREKNIPVIDVSDYTGFPEMMGGRVKTLHPKVHAGLLARRGVDDKLLDEHDILAIDLLVVNLYPFKTVVAEPKCDFYKAVENIDIGGPAMIRSAAKNHAAVTVVVDADDYINIIKELQQNDQGLSHLTRFRCAKKAFAHTAAYDAAIANYLGALNEHHQPAAFPDTFNCQFIKKADLRYGENPHQNAAFYVEHSINAGTIASAIQLQGKSLSYNNLADSDAALACVKEFERDEPACVIVKHANPCGVAVGATQAEAYRRAFLTDKTSSFGGIIAFNQMLTEETAQAIIGQQFVEVIIAPEVSKGALNILNNKANIRVLSCGVWDDVGKNYLDLKRLNNALLVQEADSRQITFQQLETVTERKPSEQEVEDLLFAWKVAKHVKSNAIVYAKDKATVGIGAGQMSRVDSARFAITKANEAELDVQSCVMASDAFFPFRDSVDMAARAGIRSIIQPGGSIRDKEVVDAANENGIVMVFTGLRHFKH